MTAPIRTHRVVGEFDQVAAAMALARVAGRLVRVRSAQELPGGRVGVVAELRDTPSHRGRAHGWRPWLTALGWLAGLAVLAAVVWGVVWLVMAVIALVSAVVAWVAAHWVGIAVTAGALVVFGLWCAAGAGSSCGGVHCGGCRR